MRHFFRVVALVAFVTSLAPLRPAENVQNADWIVRAGYVLLMDDAHTVIEDGAIAISGDHILAVGSTADIERRYKSVRMLNRQNGILMPGLIDTHTHAAMSLFRAIADDKRLQDWLEHYIFPAESKNVSPDFVKWGTELACLEMSLAGITTYTDMYYYEDTVAEATEQAGLRGVLGQTVLGFPAPDYKTWREAIDGAERYIKRFQHDPLVTPAVAPHAIYTTPDDALVESRRLASRYRVPLLIHLSETKKERDDSVSKRNATPTEALAKLGVLDGPVVAAHSVWESDSDLLLLKEHSTGVAHCPSSNTKLASGIARVTDMLRMGIHVGLGTDGFAGSNDSADLILEMDLAAKLQKVAQMNPEVLPAEQVVRMATIGGARVLGMEKKIGSLEAGKLADFITISLANAHAVPLYNVYSQIAYATKAADVEDVFVNGRAIVRNRHMLTLNEQEIFEHARHWQRRIQESLRQ
jgi:5-methylthioadenosine/S-adenosylhomocysteine deaminase